MAESNNRNQTRLAVFSGMSVGSFPEQRLVIEPTAGCVQISDEDHAHDLIAMADFLFLPQLKVPLTPKNVFALLQNVSDLEMFKTKIKKIHKILTLLWTFKVAMFSFSTAL